MSCWVALASASRRRAAAEAANSSRAWRCASAAVWICGGWKSACAGIPGRQGARAAAGRSGEEVGEVEEADVRTSPRAAVGGPVSIDITCAGGGGAAR